MTTKTNKPKRRNPSPNQRVKLNCVGTWSNGDVGVKLEGKGGKVYFRMSRTESRHLLKGLTVALPCAERAAKSWKKKAAA